MTLASVKRRYLSLGLGELTSATIFTFASVRYAGKAGGLALWSALIPLVLVLIQAGSYWLLARRWVGTSTMPTQLARAFHCFRVVNVAVLAIGFAGMIYWYPTNTGAGLLVVAVWFFGAIEYVNYFVVRLSFPVRAWFPNVRRWQTPRLVQDTKTSAQRASSSR